jgi:predicted Fe-S protein YdhL (DUF1289 family)
MQSAAELLLEKAATLADAARVPSPCLSICRMDSSSELCQGCFRTLEEIGAWGMASEDEKRAVWKLLIERARQA